LRNPDQPKVSETATSYVGPRDPDLTYIPPLDGVRGVAIIAIMGFHGGVFLTSGGFYSLDSFFVLSGFLITSLLITEWQQSAGIRLAAFWSRRAKRLLPGLLVMLIGVAVFNAFLVPSGTYPTLRADSLSSLFYFANWHFIGDGSNYVVRTGPTPPLIHMWSLAVEEQFYLLWPLIVLGILALSRSLRVLFWVCLVGALASAIEMGALYSLADVDRVYYGTDTRAQSLLIGAALAVGLALWADRRRRSGNAPVAGDRRLRGIGGDPAWFIRTAAGRRVALVVGLAGVIGTALLWTMISYNEPFAFRGGFLLAALATAAVLFSIVSAQRSTLALCLSVTPLRYVGRVSYEMYLWHYPLFLYLDAGRLGFGGLALFGVRAAVTLAVATATYYLVGRPVRRGVLRSGWTVRLITPVAVAATAIALLAATTAPSVAANSTAPTVATPPTGSHGPKVKALIVGDSTALTLAIGLSTHASSYGIASTNGGILGCGITTGTEYQAQGVDYPMVPKCAGSPADDQWYRLWAEKIAKIHPNVVMILAGRWEVTNRTYKGHWTNIESPTYAAYVKSQLLRAVRVAGSTGAHVVLLTAPCYDTGEQPNGASWPEDSRTRLAIYNDLVRQVAASTPNTSLLNFNAMACPDGRYEEYLDGQQVRLADGIHFTFTGGNVFASRIWPTIAAWGRREMGHSKSA
jgi:peptidoglycan/LPS O-acetylase OafA/YrhL/lysophospholipase L1-like esterase